MIRNELNVLKVYLSAVKLFWPLCVEFANKRYSRRKNERMKLYIP